ncbi:hypothetical protein [Mycobacteroides abscessus]|uniref:hypothetical protein n=1 Tax=Mycobacteroides abscessus TaxID=36809 RepID=UPI002106A85F|nr:hypothetical protein [Mycobacteroides abscessus]
MPDSTTTTRLHGLKGYIGLVEYVCGRPIGDEDRAELLSVRDDLKRQGDRVDEIVRRYGIDTLFDRPDTKFLGTESAAITLAPSDSPE